MKWEKQLKASVQNNREMVYNANMLMRDYYSYEQLLEMPLGMLFNEIDFFGKKAAEIAKRQADEKLKAELEGKKSGTGKHSGITRKGLIR